MNRPPIAALLIALAASGLVAQEGIPPLPDGIAMETLDSGLRYAVLAAGDGTVHPDFGDRVKVYYQGWLQDGTVFDQRARPRLPADFAIGGSMIRGWNDALQLMTPGARWRIVCPPDLAYGAAGDPPRIPAAATLTFELELVGVSKPPEFVPLDPEKQQQLESGVKCEVRREGTGRTPTAEQAFKLRYAIFDKTGRMLDSTFQSGVMISGRTEDLRVPFLREVPLKMSEGGVWIVEATKEQAFPGGLPSDWKHIPDGVTHWQLELVKVLDPQAVPEFDMPGDGAKTLDSGIAYEVLKEGEGEPPGPVDLVRCHYAGWLTDGTLFDSSYPRGEPTEITPMQLVRHVRGWSLVLQQMKPGAVWLVTIPPKLAYGEEGDPPSIPGGATLVLHIELVEVLDRR